MKTYFPKIKPYAEHRIKVETPHEIYVEECGNPKGIPVLFVHGGPGAGCSEDHRRYFDPEFYRIILFDQRGCGRSTPHASLAHNNTQALVGDMETIREKFNIKKWMLFGGSWGSTLSLVYAQTHPERVSSLILRGIFLCRSQDIDWLYEAGGAERLFPDHWQDYIAPLPKNQQHSHQLVQQYYDIFTGSDELKRFAAAKAWANWEAQLASLEPDPHTIEYLTNAHNALSLAMIECHYFINNSFLDPDQIIHNMHKIEDIPAIIVHGRYDVLCPIDNAWALAEKWPNASLNIIRSAGHSGNEPGIVDALIHATQQMAKTVYA